jgi:protein TonB
VLAIGLPYYFVVVRTPEAAVVDLDLSPLPAVPLRVASAPSAVSAVKDRVWVPSSSPSALKEGASVPEPAADSECPPPCPDNPGDFIPAGMAVNGPRWIEGMITDADYPSDARRLGQEGTVTLSVYISWDGKVRDVRLVKGCYASLDAVAMAKVRASRFTPARDSAGRPIPCKLALPIRFELK